MPREKLSEAQLAKNKKKRDKEYNASRLIDDKGNKQTYSKYLQSKGTKQLKLTLTEEEDKTLRDYAKQKGLKPQEILKKCIQKLKEGDINITGDNVTP